MNGIKRAYLLLGGFLLPSFVFAASPGTNLGTFLIYVNNILKALVPFLIAAAVVYFLYGVFKYVGAGDDEEARKSGRALMINGVIAVFVMVSLWGLVNFIGNTLGLNTDSQPGPNAPRATFPAVN